MFKNALLKTVIEQSRSWLYVMAILILLAIGLLIYQTQFIAPETVQLQQRQDLLAGKIRAREAKLVESGVPVSAVERIEESLAIFSEMIPPKERFANFIGELFHLAEQSALEIQSVSYQPKFDEETEYLSYGLSFSVQGTYDQIKKFIHHLENSKRILIIDKISLAAKKDKEVPGLVSLKINMTTLFQGGVQ